MNKRKKPLFSTLLVFLGCSLILLIVMSNGAEAETNQLIGFIGLVIISWCIISSRMMYGKYLSLILMFELSFYILTTGQSFLYALGIPLNSTYDLYMSDPVNVVNNSYIYSFFCLMLFHLGTMIGSQKKENLSIQYNSIDNSSIKTNRPDYTRAIKIFGWIVFVISIVPYIVQEIDIIRTYMDYGYRAAYLTISGTTSWAKLFSVISDYFIFSLFMLLVGYREHKQMKFVFVLLISVISFLNFAVGNRSEPICYMVALLWFLKTYAGSKGERKVATILMVVGLFLLFLVIPIIGQTRNRGTLSFSAIVDAIVGEGSIINSIKETFIAMGWSGFPLVKTMELIPKSYPFHYGQSYFFAILALIPNLVGGTHISVQYAGLPQWLKTSLKMSFGPGYSMPAEAYYNFGWFGIFLMILFGKLISSMLSEENNIDDSLKLFGKIGLFIVLFSIPRREMMTALRDGVYLVGFLYFGVKLFYRCVLSRGDRRPIWNIR